MWLFNKKNDEAAIFKKYYRKMLKITKQVAWIDNAEFELIPAMFVLCDYATANARKDRRAVSDKIISMIKKLQPNMKLSDLDKRTYLYGQVLRDEISLRGEFAFGNTETWNTNPISKITALWGDLIINPTCADNYESAPFMLRGIDEVVAFFAGVLKPVLNEMTNLFKEIYFL